MSVSSTPRRSQPSLQAGSDGEAPSTGTVKAKEQAAAQGLSIGGYVLSLPIWAYRWLISPWIGPRCRYLPTCSEYALDALRQHGAIKGGWLAVHRVGRCHPFGGQGFDPVPKTVSSEHKPALTGCDRSGDEAHARNGFDSRISF